MGDHWKSLANKLGAPGIDAPSGERTTTPEPTKAPTPAAEAVPARPARPIPPPPAPVEPPPPPPVEVEVVADKGKSKRKSSWDTLTSFFGISSPEPAAEISSAAPAETDSLPPTTSHSEPIHSETRHSEPRRSETRHSDSRHSEARESTSFRPAAPSKPTSLDELFGNAPRQDLSWEKPEPRRMVDDVSGWDDDDRPATKEPTLDDQADTFTPQPEALEEDEAREGGTRRRRRRRRGSRRDREPRVEGETPTPAARSASPADDADPWVEDLIESESESDDWVEPTSFIAEADAPEALDGDDAPMPERRSSRRRRRGRGRSERQPEGSLPASDETLEARPAREVREPREGRELREPREPRPPREPREARPQRVSREARIIDEAEVDVEPPRRESRRKERPARQRPARSTSDAAREPGAAVDEMDDQVDSSLALELEGEPGTGNRHPKIPTWADSLEAIISANMENHRRSDSRGGPPRGNRPRGGGNGPGRR